MSETMSDTMSADDVTPTDDVTADLPIVIELDGHLASDIADYLHQKVTAVLSHTGRKPIQVHVHVRHHGDPAREQQVSARATVRLAGKAVHVHADAVTARSAADLLVERLDHRIARISRVHRGDRTASHGGHGKQGSHGVSADGRRRLLPTEPTAE